MKTMEDVPENGNSPLTRGEFVKCWIGLDRRVRAVEITGKISLAIATAIFVAVLVQSII